MEGEIIRKAAETKLKKYWYCLLGKELYVYKNKKEEKHKSMHSLVGVFIKDEIEEQLDSTTVLYPFKLIFKPADGLRNKYSDYYITDYMDQLKSVPQGSLLYSVYAIDQPGQSESKIGELRTTSPFVSSYWGDESLFFRHNYMDLDLAENPNWTPYVPSFSPFRGSIPAEQPKKCPFH